MKKCLLVLLTVLLFVSVFAGAFNVQSAKANASSLGQTVQAADPVDWWPMFHHDPAHTGYSTSTGPTTNNLLWNYTTGGSVDESSAVVGGLVYMGSADEKLYCLNATTGKLVWNYTTGGFVSSPAVVGGLVYMGSADEKLYCLNATTGKLVWNYTTGGFVSSPAVVGGLVYFASSDYNVYCLNAATGALVWRYTIPTSVHVVGWGVMCSPAVVGGRVYVGSWDDSVYCLNATTGKLVWSYTTGSYVVSSPAVVGGRVYVGSFDCKVYCLNATTGKLVWNYTTGGFVYSSPAVVGGLVYMGSADEKLYCLNATTGKLVWNYTTGGFVSSSPAVVGGLVYVGSAMAPISYGKVFCLNAITGKLVWNYTAGNAVVSSPAVASGVVYVGSEDHKIYAIGSPVPLITSLSVSPNPFSPNMDGSKDNTTIKAKFNVAVKWNLQIRNSSGATLRTWTGTGSSLSIVWDGKNSTGFKVPDGAYTVRLSGKDLLGVAFTTKSATVTVDTKLPVVTGISVSPTSFNPQVGHTTRINYTLPESCYVTIKIYNSTGSLKRTLLNGVLQTSGLKSIVWNGKDSSNTIVPTGTYTIKIYIADIAGNKATPYPITKTVTVDMHPPAVTGVSVTPSSFRPSIGQTTRINYTMSEGCYVTIRIYNSTGALKKTLVNYVLQASGLHSIVWNGKDTLNTIVPLGTYTIKIYVVDKAGNKATPYPITKTVAVL